MSDALRRGPPWRFEQDGVIRFGACDPAGIAYFPRLDELLNGLFEDWCTSVGIPFNELLVRDRLGFPLVHATVEYEAPLRLGDTIRLIQQVHAIGTSSITFDLAIERGSVRCLSARHVRVMMALDADKSSPLPAALRARFATDTETGA